MLLLFQVSVNQFPLEIEAFPFATCMGDYVDEGRCLTPTNLDFSSQLEGYVYLFSHAASFFLQ